MEPADPNPRTAVNEAVASPAVVTDLGGWSCGFAAKLLTNLRQVASLRCNLTGLIYRLHEHLEVRGELVEAKRIDGDTFFRDGTQGVRDDV